MRSLDEHSKNLEDSAYRELRVLEEVDGSPNLSQRLLALKLGIALGVANILLRKLAKQGHIRMTQLGWKRWAYSVTPAGMAHKLNLTKSYVARFVDHYRRVRHVLREDLRSQPLDSESRVAIVGTSELAELAFLALRDIGVRDIEVFAPESDGRMFLAMEVQLLDSLTPERYSKIVITTPGENGHGREGLLSSGAAESQIVEMLDSHQRSVLSAQEGPK